MKIKLLLLALPLTWINHSYAQQGGNTSFRPQKVAYFYPTTSVVSNWNLSFTRHFTYDNQGNTLTVVTTNEKGIPETIDSLYYTPQNQLKSKVSLTWNNDKNSFVYNDKVVNIFEGERLASSLVYSWKDLWELETRSEHLQNWDANHKIKTDVTSTYSKTTDKWSPLTKTVTNYNQQNQMVSMEVFSANDQGIFVPYIRQTYGGWHNYEKQIYTTYKSERYINNTWVLDELRSVSKSGELWVELEDRYWGPTAGKYKHLFKEDTTFSELLKEGYGGWLSLIVHNKSSKVDQVIHNHFIEDSLVKAEKDENEFDNFGNLIRTTEHIVNGKGQTLEFTQVVHGLVYNPNQLLLVDSAMVTTMEGKPFHPIEKIVYSDYIDIGAITSITERSEKLDSPVLFPNPSKGVLYVSKDISVASVAVYKTTGEWVDTITTEGNLVNLCHLNSGVYHLKIVTNEKVFNQKIVLTSN